MDRRNFIKMSAATAAFSVIKPLGTMAGEKMNRPVRIGFIGTGNRGTYGVITSMCRNNKVELYALADLFRDRIDQVLPHLNNLNKENGLPNIEERNIYVGKDAYRQLLQDDKVDAVVIATPAYAHPFIFEEAVKARKHVYCEKPAAPDAYGALRMIKAAQGVRDLSLVMGFQVRHSSAFDEMIRRVHNGDIGRIVAAQLYYNAGGAGGAKPAVEDDEFRIRHHFQYLELSGGTLNDQAVHMMDICREVLQANPLYAMGHSSRKGVKCEYGNFNTNYQILYKYPEDINVMVQQTSVGSATGGVVARFFGENGTAEAKYSGGVFITGPNKWDSGIDNALGDADPNKGKSFIGSIISGNYINEIEAGCNSTLMAILGREAAARGGKLTWNKLVKTRQCYGNQPDLSKF